MTSIKDAIIIVLLLPFAQVAIAQKGLSKPSIDTSVFGKWPTIEGVVISDNGKYAMYKIDNMPVGSKTLVITSTDAKWKRNVVGVERGEFTQNSKSIVYLSNDSMFILRLGSGKSESVSGVSSYSLVENGGKNYLAYLQSNQLILRGLSRDKQRVIPNVNSYQFSDNHEMLIIQTKLQDKSIILQCFDVKTETSIQIWKGTDISNLIFDKNGNQMAFITGENKSGEIAKSIWIYTKGNEKAKLLVGNNELAEIDKGLEIKNIVRFSNDNKGLFFKMEEISSSKPDPGMVRLNLWSYNDPKLQSRQLRELHRDYLAIIRIPEKKIIQIEKDNEHVTDFNMDFDDMLIVYENTGESEESHWNIKAKKNLYLVSTKNYERKLFRTNTLLNYAFSPSGKYLIFYDPDKKNYFSYLVSNGKITNITQNINTSWLPYGEKRPESLNFSFFLNTNLAGWLYNDKAILLYDQNDIWQIDPEGTCLPINLTSGYGKKNSTSLRLAIDHNEYYIRTGEKLLLRVFNRKTKDNGFYEIVIGQPKASKLLTIGKWMYFPPYEIDTYVTSIPPIKAKNKEGFIIQRMSAIEAPNLFYTNNFKQFFSLSNLHTQTNYNWYSTELHEWQLPNGSTSQGILYKPEDFDPNKKYPLIFYYYETLSDNLNAYLRPAASDGSLNIPWYVSNGYLVFTPDIHYEFGSVGESAVNTIVSAANYLSKFPYVNRNKMGIQGISYGGFETNYIVTHSNIFAAACSASGPSDMISWQGTLDGGGGSRQGFIEKGQIRIGATLWERPDLYIKNSPIFRVDKITTPLLLMHTKIDNGVSFNQALEFFTSLRRLGKKSWLLEYEDGNHGVWGKSADDFSIRMSQFFDHFLKGLPAPKWMTKGIPAKMKGIDNGLDYDTEIKQLGSGLLMIDSLQN